MPIDFDLGDAHPDFRRAIPEILLPLAERYPGARLTSVCLYRPEPGDTSMGATLPSGEIILNSYWFSRSPDELSAAAKRHAVVLVDDVPMGWHACMPEPKQILIHEFFHAFRNGHPDVMRWADDAWARSTRRLELSPSGYALSDAEEFWAEAMATRELGIKFGLSDSLEEFLASR